MILWVVSLGQTELGRSSAGLTRGQLYGRLGWMVWRVCLMIGAGCYLGLPLHVVSGFQEGNPTAQMFIKPLFVSYLLMSLWQNQVTWPSPESLLEGTTQWHRPRRPFIYLSTTKDTVTIPVCHQGDRSCACLPLRRPFTYQSATEETVHVPVCHQGDHSRARLPPRRPFTYQSATKAKMYPPEPHTLRKRSVSIDWIFVVDYLPAFVQSPGSISSCIGRHTCHYIYLPFQPFLLVSK